MFFFLSIIYFKSSFIFLRILNIFLIFYRFFILLEIFTTKFSVSILSLSVDFESRFERRQFYRTRERTFIFIFNYSRFPPKTKTQEFIYLSVLINFLFLILSGIVLRFEKFSLFKTTLRYMYCLSYLIVL